MFTKNRTIFVDSVPKSRQTVEARLSLTCFIKKR